MASKTAAKPNPSAPDTIRQQFLMHAKRAAELAVHIRSRDKPNPKTGELWRTQDGSLVLILALYEGGGEDYDEGSLDAVLLQSADPSRDSLQHFVISEEGRANWSNDLNCAVRVATSFSLYFSGYSL